MVTCGQWLPYWTVKLQTFFSHLPVGNGLSWPSSCLSNHFFSVSDLCLRFQHPHMLFLKISPLAILYFYPTPSPQLISYIPPTGDDSQGCMSESHFSAELPTSIANPQIAKVWQRQSWIHHFLSQSGVLPTTHPDAQVQNGFSPRIILPPSFTRANQLQRAWSLLHQYFTCFLLHNHCISQDLHHPCPWIIAMASSVICPPHS